MTIENLTFTKIVPATGRILGVFTAMLFLTVCSHTQAGMIVNGGFEAGNLSGWTVTETGSAGAGHDYGVTNGSDGGYGPVAHSGSYGAYINPPGGTVDFSQTIDIPTAGNYAIDFWVQPYFNDADVVSVFLGGVELYTTNFTEGGPYTEIDLTAAAGSGSQTVDFQFAAGSGPIFFDDASLTALEPTVPEPTTALAGLLLLPFAGATVRSCWKSRFGSVSPPRLGPNVTAAVAPVNEVCYRCRHK